MQRPGEGRSPRGDRLVVDPRATCSSLQEWGKRAVEELLARMAPAGGQSRRAGHLLSARMTAERSAEPPNNLPPRERKAGCKNFYWKGFTSC